MTMKKFRVLTFLFALLCAFTFSNTSAFASIECDRAYINDSNHDVISIILETREGEKGRKEADPYIPIQYNCDGEILTIDNQSPYEDLYHIANISLPPGYYVYAYSGYAFDTPPIDEHVIAVLSNGTVLETSYTNTENKIFRITDSTIDVIPLEYNCTNNHSDIAFNVYHAVHDKMRHVGDPTRNIGGAIYSTYTGTLESANQ